MLTAALHEFLEDIEVQLFGIDQQSIHVEGNRFNSMRPRARAGKSSYHSNMPSSEEPIRDRYESRRDSFVPLHTTDLVEFLSQHPKLDRHDRSAFKQLASLILALLHHVYRQRHEQMTYLYAPLDPDRDTLLMSLPLAEPRERLCAEVVEHLQDVLRRANYHKLGRDEIQRAMDAASRWGVRMRVDFNALRLIEVYARGDVLTQKSFRSWRRLFRLTTADVHLYQRLVVIFRTDPDSSDTRFDWRKMYLRMFKNIPQQDVDMVLPATRIKLTWLDHSTIVLPSLYAVISTLWRTMRLALLLTLVGLLKTAALVVLVLASLVLGLKSLFTSTINTRRRYHLNVAQNLYYQSLDNNAGALLRLLEEGEQQEACEVVLAYFAAAIMLQSETDPPQPVGLAEMDAICEEITLEATGVHVDFDVQGAAEHLVQLGLLRAEGDKWIAPTLSEANQILNRTWDQWFA